MKKYIFILLTIILVSCLSNETSSSTTTYTTEDETFWTVIIDSCEYINGFNRLAHKGNCKFCKERRLKEMLDCYD